MNDPDLFLFERNILYAYFWRVKRKNGTGFPGEYLQELRNRAPVEQNAKVNEVAALADPVIRPQVLLPVYF